MKGSSAIAVLARLKGTVTKHSPEMTVDRFNRAEAPGDRQRWMSLFARAATEELEQAWAGMPDRPEYAFLRRPETGLAMIRGRAGGIGQPFNVGEMTVTRCAVRLAGGIVGHGYVAGRDARHAELAAIFDALMQRESDRRVLEEAVAGPVERRLAARRRDAAAKAAATRVDFFTLVRGEDEC